jgi:threonine dehydratase
MRHSVYDGRLLQVTRHVSLDSVRAAAGRVYQAAVRTPLVRLDPLGRDGPEIWLKLEVFQPIGSFKIRGAMNAVAQLAPADRAAGVWTVSAGNAAQGVALAAREVGVPRSVLVMDGAPATKLAAIERLGASIVKAPFDECWRTVETHQSSRMSGRFVHPFDDDDFISGNGTCALEILEALPDVDAIVAPMGGGGLLAGLGTVLRELRPDARLYAAEPENAAPLSVSLKAGRAMRFDGWSRSWVDGAGGQSVLPSMFEILRPLLAGAIVVPLDLAAGAMRLAADRCHVIMEGAAACAVAAARMPALAGHRKIVAVVSGGNIDLKKFAELTVDRPA